MGLAYVAEDVSSGLSIDVAVPACRLAIEVGPPRPAAPWALACSQAGAAQGELLGAFLLGAGLRASSAQHGAVHCRKWARLLAHASLRSEDSARCGPRRKLSAQRCQRRQHSPPAFNAWRPQPHGFACGPPPSPGILRPRGD